MKKKFEEDVVYCLCDYHPYRQNTNPNINKDTYRIMDLKDSSHPNHIKVVEYFGVGLNNAMQILAKSVNTDVMQVAIVPSSEKGKVSDGLKSMLKYVCSIHIIYNGDFIYRDKTVPKAHLGGGRSYKKNIESVSVHCKPEVDIPLLLIDDVSTTQNSIRSCRDILKKSGVKHVFMLAIGRTI